MKIQAAALLAAMLTLSLVSCGEASISPPETTVTTAPETTIINHVKIPVDNYIGLWFDGTDPTVNIDINSISSDGLMFSSYFDNFYIAGKAFLRDGKYTFASEEYADSSLYKATGEISLDEDGVTLTYHTLTDGSAADAKPLHFTVKDEPDIIDWPPSNMPKSVESDLQQIIDELSRKGWEDIEVYPHEPNWNYRFGPVYDPIELPEGGILYCITAHYPWDYTAVYVNVYSVYVGEERIDDLTETYYISALHALRGSEMYNLLLKHEETMYGIVDADNELLNYFLAEAESGPQV